MTPERQQLVDHAKELWETHRSQRMVEFTMHCEGYSQQQCQYVKRWFPNWEVIPDEKSMTTGNSSTLDHAAITGLVV